MIDAVLVPNMPTPSPSPSPQPAPKALSQLFGGASLFAQALRAAPQVFSVVAL